MPLMLLINSPEIREKKALLLLQKSEIKAAIPPTIPQTAGVKTSDLSLLLLLPQRTD